MVFTFKELFVKFLLSTSKLLILADENLNTMIVTNTLYMINFRLVVKTKCCMLQLEWGKNNDVIANKLLSNLRLFLSKQTGQQSN